MFDIKKALQFYKLSNLRNPPKFDNDYEEEEYKEKFEEFTREFSNELVLENERSKD